MPGKTELRHLPSVDEALKSERGQGWLAQYPRRFVLEGIREALEARRARLLAGDKLTAAKDDPTLYAEMEAAIVRLSSLSLRPLINATGIVMHTNLGRSPLSKSAIANILAVAGGYSNLEYDLGAGKRGKRSSHIKRLLCSITGAEDGVALNNNAGAVLLCLSAMARGREVIVSRGELVEIGGSFRVPEVMAQSGAILKEVGATNKTHLRDYERAITENTGLLLKVHRSNFRMEGFTEDVGLEELKALGQKYNLPVMYDMGSGCLRDLRPLGIQDEPTVMEIVKTGVDIVTFSGDKLLGGPQAGMIVGNKRYIADIASHPLMRALRIDKLTLAALEATLMEYADMERAAKNIPTVRMLVEPASEVKRRAQRIARAIRAACKGLEMELRIEKDITYSGGGALPARAFDTYVVALYEAPMSATKMEERLRAGVPPVIGRIREGVLLLDARTVSPEEIPVLAKCVRAALKLT